VTSLPAGKLPAAFLKDLLDSGEPLPDDVLLPPGLGEDACALRVEAGALIAATDPITLTGRGVGAHAVVVNANDVAVTGARPRWFLACVLLPIGTTREDVRGLFEEMRGELQKLGASLVGGHTELTSAVRQPVVVGQMLGQHPEGRVVRTGGVRAGDVILQLGPAPVEGAAVLAHEAGARLGSVAADLLAQARDALRDPGICVVEPALRSADLGATALHDPTEGGLSAGLHELAEASGLALRVDEEAVLWFAPGRAVCAPLGADPWGVLASGTLLAAFAGDRADRVCAILESEGYAVRVIAQALRGAGVHREDGSSLPRYERDELSRVLGIPAP
jgi:hydrogenase maturation factor